MPPFAIVIVVVSRRVVARRAVECLCRVATADARDDATTTTMVVLQIFLAEAADDGERGTGEGDGGAG